jgi:cell division protease FtsH
VFLGRDFGHQANYSDEMAARIDVEVRLLIDTAHDQAVQILSTHRATLDRLAAALIDQETLDTPALMEILGDLPPWVAAKRVPPPPVPVPVPVGASLAAKVDDPGTGPGDDAGTAVKRLRRRLRRVTNRPATA